MSLSLSFGVNRPLQDLYNAIKYSNHPKQVRPFVWLPEAQLRFPEQSEVKIHFHLHGHSQFLLTRVQKIGNFFQGGKCKNTIFLACYDSKVLISWTSSPKGGDSLVPKGPSPCHLLTVLCVEIQLGF